MAQILKTTGEIETIIIDKSQRLIQLQNIVGGFIEIIKLKSNKYMIINEEGKLLNLPVNRLASSIYKQDIIVGNALICDKDEIE